MWAFVYWSTSSWKVFLGIGNLITRFSKNDRALKRSENGDISSHDTWPHIALTQTKTLTHAVTLSLSPTLTLAVTSLRIKEHELKYPVASEKQPFETSIRTGQ